MTQPNGPPPVRTDARASSIARRIRCWSFGSGTVPRIAVAWRACKHAAGKARTCAPAPRIVRDSGTLTPRHSTTDMALLMVTSPRVPVLCAGVRLTRDEFERRYSAMPDLKKAELIEGVVYM